ncbi:MAG: hypothetical protein ACYS8Z_05330, partial [Planctomycetota bacterium]
MGFFGRIAEYFGGAIRLARVGSGLTVQEFAARLKLEIEEIAVVQSRYHRYTIPKRNGGLRAICAPEP